eukprot:TRINITY_DN26610_c0_g1_i1.p3 TRINITY_DN26610_c0_g1~~TRINITY_DN26610_c0_g1_i1.p3  ORF type:complete len:119 (+),score=40.41 TRINITY_DN26610_c0_g1_i1:92-448(+)
MAEDESKEKPVKETKEKLSAKPAEDAKGQPAAADENKKEESAAKVEEKNNVDTAFSPQMLVAIAAGALVFATVVAAVQQCQALEDGNFKRWTESLFEEHVVPPPRAANDVCTIQFCQS